MIKHSQPTIEPDSLVRVLDVIQSRNLASGPHVKMFEEQMCQYIGMNYSLATNSGTSALHLALLALDIEKGHEVIIPSYVCTAVLNAVQYTGACPVVVDISKNSFNIDIQAVKKAITPQTRAIIVPHMFGVSAHIDEFTRLGIPIIEDCAQAVGAEYQGKKLGSFGDISIFSFYATKMMTTGEGGMILTKSSELWNKMKDLNDYDNRNDYKIRYNYKMTDFQAVLGLSQLHALPGFIERRRNLAGMYTRKLSECGFTLPDCEVQESAWFRYVIRVNEKLEHVITIMNQQDIEVKSPIYKPIHSYLGLNQDHFKNTEKAVQTVLSIPLYPLLKNEEVDIVVYTLKQLSHDIITCRLKTESV